MRRNTAAFCCWLDYCSFSCMLVGEIPCHVFGQFCRGSILVLDTALVSTEKLTNAWRKSNPNHFSHQMWCWVQLVPERIGLESGVDLSFSSKPLSGGQTQPVTAGSWS